MEVPSILMALTRRAAIAYVMVLSLVVVSSASLSLQGALVRASDAGSQTYYGYVPSVILVRGATGLDPRSVQLSARVVLIGNHDGTSASAFLLPERKLLGEFTLNRMERVELSLPNGSVFKVVADKPLTVMLAGGVEVTESSGVSTFQTSVGGGYVGREFIFLALESRYPSRGSVGGLPQRVYAFEECDVTVWDENETNVAEFRLPANGFKELSLTPDIVYRLEASGNVMVQTFALGEFRAKTCFYPAVEGGFLGKLFYGSGPMPEATVPPKRGFVASGAGQPALKVADLEFQKAYGEFEFNDSWAFLPASGLKVRHLVVEAETPILLYFKSDENSTDGGGVAMGGLRAGQTSYLYAPRGESYLFAAEETVVTLDDVDLRVPADSVVPIPEGVHKLAATKNVLFEVVNIWWNGLSTFGVTLPSVESLDVSNEGLKLRKVGEESLPWTYIAAGVAAAVVAVVLLMARRRR